MDISFGLYLQTKRAVTVPLPPVHSSHSDIVIVNPLEKSCTLQESPEKIVLTVTVWK